jgi:hypothetical protein
VSERFGLQLHKTAEVVAQPYKTADEVVIARSVAEAVINLANAVGQETQSPDSVDPKKLEQVVRAAANAGVKWEACFQLEHEGDVLERIPAWVQRPAHANDRQVHWEPNRELYNLALAAHLIVHGLTAEQSPQVRIVDYLSTLTILRDDTGHLSVNGDLIHRRFLPALDHLDLTRIRRCPVCGKFYFARRTDAGACSPHCQNVNRVRRSRKKQGERKSEP